MKLQTLLAGLSVLILAASCTAGTEGLFASIGRETKIVSNDGFPKSGTVTHMAELGSRYYSAGGAYLFQRAQSDVKWSGAPIASGYNNVTAVGLAGTTLYAVANRGASDTGRLFSSGDGATWADVTPAGATPFGLVPVRQNDGLASNELILTTYSASTGFASAYLIGGSVGASIALGTNYSTPITAAAKASGGAYYLLNENDLLQMASSAATSVTKVTGTPTGANVGFILVDTGFTNKAYITTKTGGIYGATFTSGTTWTSVLSRTGLTDTAGKALSLGPMLYEPNAGLWIGTGSASFTEGTGYATLSTTEVFDRQPPAITNSNNYTSSKIATSSVPLLFKGSDGYFLGTVAHGLWKWDSTKKEWSQQ